jgi:hypothetical protein
MKAAATEFKKEAVCFFRSFLTTLFTSANIRFSQGSQSGYEERIMSQYLLVIYASTERTGSGKFPDEAVSLVTKCS